LLERGRRLEVELVGLSPLGDGIAVVEGCELHVPGALPGERARVRLEHRSRQHARAWAFLEEVTQPIATRREPPCPHQGRCTGCALMIVDEPTQRRFKQRLIRARFGLELDRLVHRDGEELGYRWSSKRVFGRGGRSALLGSYRRGTHDVAAMTGCLVEHPVLRRGADEPERAASADDVGRAVQGALGDGDRTLRAAWLRTDGGEGCLLGLVGPAGSRAQAERLAQVLAVPTDVTWSVSPEGAGDGLRGAETVVLRGTGRLTVELFGTVVEVGPMGFLQPNPRVAELAYRDLLSSPAGEAIAGRRALDLYAGAGATTALLRARFEEVVACDEHPESAASLGEPALRADELLARELERARGPVDLVVADPPRAGLGPEVGQQLLQLGPARIHLMSCNAASLARDLALLAPPEGRYALECCRGYDTLPQTPHVEVVAWLRRRGA
jgi:23S rRNA (uracil1939-C5)-methyltransferase